MQKKKILLIVPKFFGYEKYIKRTLIKLNYEVFMIYENPNEYSIITKCKLNININNQIVFDKYYDKHIKSKYFDLILAIRASTVSSSFIAHLRKENPKAKFCLYQWDSVENNPNALKIAEYFDNVSTFDIADAEKFGWNYRPLFYVESSDRMTIRPIDIAYICTLHSQRVKIYNSLKKIPNNKYLYLYSKYSRLIKEKYINKNPEFKNIAFFNVKSIPISLKKVNKILSDSNIVVDYTHPGQTGYTMRTCEAIGHRCKLLTNNKMIYKADFYNSQNIYVYNEENFEIPESFLSTPYKEISLNIYNKYSLINWTKELIEYEKIN